MVYAIAVSFVVSAFFLTFSPVSAESEVHKNPLRHIPPKHYAPAKNPPAVVKMLLKPKMNNLISIRKANLNDFISIYNFVNELEETLFNTDMIKKAYELNIRNPDFIYLIAKIANKPIGYLSCHSQLLLHHGGHRIAEIQEMYIIPEYRKIGVGKRLIDELKNLAKQENIEQIEVTSNNIRIESHRFYEREMFVQSHKKFTWKLK